MQSRVREVTIPDIDDVIFYFYRNDSKNATKKYTVRIKNKDIIFSIGHSMVDGYLIDCYDNIRPIFEYKSEVDGEFASIEDILTFQDCPLLNDFYLTEQEAKNVAEYLIEHYPCQEN